MVVYSILQIIGFAKSYETLEFTYLETFQLQLFIPYFVGFVFLFLTLFFVKNIKGYLQVERILSIVFWIVYFVFSIINRAFLFMFYVKSSEDSSSFLENLIIIEVFFLLALAFTGITYRTDISKYLSYTLYALAGTSFIFFLIRLTAQWEPVLRKFILLSEFWIEVLLICSLGILLTVTIITSFRKREKV